MTKGEQMMADLGYEPDEVYYTEEKAFKKTNPYESYYRISFAEGEVEKEYCQPLFFHSEQSAMSYNELLACAEIVKEIKSNEKK